MERIGIYGGTFNPPHIGHIQAAKQAVTALGLSKLLLIPDRIAPHKVMPANSASAEQRLAMLRMAVSDCPEIEVSDIELRREGVSYTYETVAQLKERYPASELVLLMGTDMFLTFHTWKHPEEILKHAALGVFYRGERGEKADIDAKMAEMQQQGAKVQLVENDVISISSTQLRRLLVFRCADAFLPEGVGAYIREQGLYDTAAQWKNLPMEELEKVVISLLNPNRVNHVLGCRDTAVELAKRWGADVTDAARAGILHDITKAIDGPLQLTLCAEYGIVLNKFSQENPKTLHALTGSLIADHVFGENENVVRAIRHHTTGRADMTLLEKIIYIADYIEVNRDFPGVDELRAAAYRDIDEALLLGFETTIAHVRRQGQELSQATVEAAQFLRDRGVKIRNENAASPMG